MPHSAVLFAALVVFAFALVSRRVERGMLTAPMVFSAAGLLYGMVLYEEGGTVGLEAMRTLAEITLAVTLFVDAARIDARRLRRDHAEPIRLLLVAMPLSMLLGAALALALFPSAGPWAALVLGIILAPTDAALGQAVVVDERLPERVRRTLNVESGLNDGLAFPFLLIALSLASGNAEGSHWPWLLATQIAFGPLVGAAAGLVGARLIGVALSRGLIDGAFLRISGLSLVLVAWAGAELVGGNGFLAAFVCGLVFGASARQATDEIRDFGEVEGDLLSLIVFFLFGTLLLPELFDAIDWRHVLYAVLSLTIVRMAPVALALAGLGLRAPTVAFLGWFGPRGLASIIYLLLIIGEYPIAGLEAAVMPAVLATVALSVLAHGLSAMPLTLRYARHVGAVGRAGARAEHDPDTDDTVTAAHRIVRGTFRRGRCRERR